MTQTSLVEKPSEAHVELPKTINFTVESVKALPIKSLLSIQLTGPSGEKRALVVPQRYARKYTVGTVIPLIPITT
jgi:hypothetical protein